MNMSSQGNGMIRHNQGLTASMSEASMAFEAGLVTAEIESDYFCAAGSAPSYH
ncbi:MAG: hypothetical protein MZV63_25425 [Marinilabiliales bacterium]|nr:hypothetical protein [Marinilabiliales bacterium]